jgi:hypothetical protein
MMKYVDWMPRGLRQEVSQYAASIRLADTKTAGTTYFANHCECGAVIGDHFLHQPDEVFFPVEKRNMDDLRLVRLKYAEAFRTVADPSWGVADRILENAGMAL